MPKRSGKFDTERRRHFIREWRKHRNLTQGQLAARLEMSVANLSRIETGEQPYTQPVLEAIADALLCPPQDIIARDPNAPEWGFLELLNKASPAKRIEIERVIRALLAA